MPPSRREPFEAAPTPREAIRRTLSAFSRSRRRVFFVQIGSSDGVQCDPLHHLVLRDRWAGVLVEPVPYLFRRLRAAYPRRRDLLFANCAIAEHDGFAHLYRLRETDDDLPSWYEGLGTFLPEVLLKHRWSIPELEGRIVSERVRCLTLPTLFRLLRVTRLDVLHIDTEGYDARVLAQLDFDRYRPGLVLFEHKHLTPGERVATLELLHLNGYTTLADDELGDTLAVRPARARDAWRAFATQQRSGPARRPAQRSGSA